MNIEAYKKAFYDSPIGMAFVSPEGKWLEVNDAIPKMLGYTKEELLNKTFQDITHPDDLESDLSLVKKMLAKEISNYQMEKRYFDKDGKVVWIILSVTLVWKDDNTPDFFISQIQDVTKMKEAMNEFKLLNKKVLSRELKLGDLEKQLEELKNKKAAD